MELKTIYLFLLLILPAKIFAGWYECYTFTGKIGNYPVTLSCQIRDGYFGEKDKAHFNIIGVYKYEKYNNPIRLEGVYNKKAGTVVLYEMHQDKAAATFRLDLKSANLKGYWSNESRKLEVDLLLKEKLSDLGNEDFDNREIIQYNSLKNFYLVGVYSKSSGSYKTTMTELKIIRKSDNILYQTLNFDDPDIGTGNLMTIIYDNVSAGTGHDNYTVSCDIGRIGGFYIVEYNRNTGKFILDPEPVAEGGSPDE